jgi:ubiquinone/menaquinone biosynthesis C-methylase UbiE
MSTGTATYLLGHEDPELQRLEEQARTLAPATATILRSACIAPGMRVLDLGTGAGDVAIAAAELVGPTGSVVGIDQAPKALGHAEQRCALRGLTNVTFVEGDVTTAEIDGTFDAVVGRLVLLYVDDPVAVVRRWCSRIRSGGVFVAMEFEMTAAGLLPPGPLFEQAKEWFLAAFRHAGHDPLLGARLAEVLRAAGLENPVALGLQAYLDDSTGPPLLAGIVRTLLPAIERAGIATAAEVDIDTLAPRVAEEQRRLDALFKPPTLVGAWARVT